MQIAFQALIGTDVLGADERIGTLHDVLFEQESMRIRYLDVETSSGLLQVRRVLFAPEAVQATDWPSGVVKIHLTGEQVRACPQISQHESLPQQLEHEHAHEFGWKPYWAPGPLGIADGPSIPTETVPVLLQGEDADIWNARKLLRYGVRDPAGDVGYVGDLIVDDRAWTIPSLVIDIGNWITGRRVVIPSDQVKSIDWETHSVHLLMAREQIERCDDFQPALAVNEESDGRRFDYYGRRREG